MNHEHVIILRIFNEELRKVRLRALRYDREAWGWHVPNVPWNDPVIQSRRQEYIDLELQRNAYCNKHGIEIR